MRIKRNAVIALVLLAMGAGLTAVVAGSGIPRRVGDLAPPPAELSDKITVLGLPNARFWAWYDTQGEALVEEWERSLQRERANAGQETLPAAHLLAISGGGGDGAFGAGIVCGWYETGNMPAFKLVTGISTGSMIAPFAFLGGEYITQLRQLYTSITQSDIHTLRAVNGLYGVVFHDAASDTEPLHRLISRYMNEAMLLDIATAYRRGRLLMIATASLDQQRPILWNIGAIANSGHPRSLELVRKIILASASIPGAFPPVMIDVEAGGTRYQEMNVDAGVVAQTFLYPIWLGLRSNLRVANVTRETSAYILRNSRLDAQWASVNRDFMTITERSIDTMIHYLGYNDILRLYDTAKRDGIDFNLGFIETDFDKKKREQFDSDYMRALFEYAYSKGKAGPEWHKEPPILDQWHRRLGRGSIEYTP
jgi:hypothetical protein